MHTKLVGVGKDCPGLGVIGHRGPVLATQRRWPECNLFARPRLHCHIGFFWPSSFQINAVCPIEFVDKLRSRNQFAGCPVQNIEKPIAVRLHQNFASVYVSMNKLIHSVEIKRVIRRGLIVPLDGASFGIKREDRGGIKIISRACRRIPRRRISGTPKYSIQFRIIRPS